MEVVPSLWTFLAIVFAFYPTTRAYNCKIRPSQERIQHHLWNSWSAWSGCTDSLVTRHRGPPYGEGGSNTAIQKERRTCIFFNAKTADRSPNQTVNNEPSCPGGFDFMFTMTSGGKKTSSCYMIGLEKVQLLIAEKQCHHFNSTLVSIETAKEQNHLKDILGNEQSLTRPAYFRRRGFWTSGQKIFLGVWRWTGSNALMKFQNWAHGEPLELLNLYVVLYYKSMQWATTPFAREHYMFICEKYISP